MAKKIRADASFTVVSNYVMFDSDLSTKARMVYATIARRAFHGNDSFPSIAKICRETGIKSYTTVRSAIEELENEGVLQKEHRFLSNGKQTSNLYTLKLSVIDNQGGQNLTPPPTKSDPEEVNREEGTLSRREEVTKEVVFDSAAFTNLLREYAGFDHRIMALEYRLAKEDAAELGGVEALRPALEKAFKRDMFPFNKGEPISYGMIHRELSRLLNGHHPAKGPVEYKTIVTTEGTELRVPQK